MMNVPIDPWFQALVYDMTTDEYFSKGTTIVFFFKDVATGETHSANMSAMVNAAVVFDFPNPRGTTRFAICSKLPFG
jgi:hypothetical protein